MVEVHGPLEGSSDNFFITLIGWTSFRGILTHHID